MSYFALRHLEVNTAISITISSILFDTGPSTRKQYILFYSKTAVSEQAVIHTLLLYLNIDEKV